MADINITDQNFKQEVLESSQPVVVDFWAPWCVAPETNISLANGLSLPASSLAENKKLVGWNGKRGVGTVTYSKVVSDAGHCKLITTSSGRSIKVTDEHLFFTPKGWKKAEELIAGEKIAVFPSDDASQVTLSNHSLLISENDIKDNASSKMQVSKYITQLSEFGLLPLSASNPKILLLARLMGALFSDGNLYEDEKNNYRELSFALGQIEDRDNVIKDIEELGFSTHANYRESRGQIAGRIFMNKGFRVKSLSTALWLLFKSLGIPVGNKTDIAYNLPDWILHAEKPIKKEFLAGYMGGDGPKVNIRLQARKNKQSYNKLNINDLEFHKRKDLLENGLKFARDLSLMLDEFGVKVTKVFNEDEKYLRKDGTQTAIIHMRFAHTFAVGLFLAQNIGYRYCRQKEIFAMHTGEFLREIGEKKKQWHNLYQQVKDLAKQGLGYRRVSRKLGIPPLLAFNWIKGRDKATSPKHFLKFPTWLKEATDGLRDGFVWGNIANISPVFLPKVAKISVDKTHNFIANGFLVHNCGPCRIVSPIIDELAKEYEGKVKVGKINVDENPQTAGQYGVMSIPSIVFFKNGQPVKTMVGAQSKENYKQEIEQMLS